MRLSLLAGSGALVPAAVAAAQEAGHKVQVLTLTPRDDLPVQRGHEQSRRIPGPSRIRGGKDADAHVVAGGIRAQP